MLFLKSVCKTEADSRHRCGSVGNSYMLHADVRVAASRAAVRGSCKEEAALQRSVVQHWNELVKPAPSRVPVMVFPQISESRQPRMCSLSTPVALNSKGGGGGRRDTKRRSENDKFKD